MTVRDVIRERSVRCAWCLRPTWNLNAICNRRTCRDLEARYRVRTARRPSPSARDERAGQGDSPQAGGPREDAAATHLAAPASPGAASFSAGAGLVAPDFGHDGAASCRPAPAGDVRGSSRYAAEPSTPVGSASLPRASQVFAAASGDGHPSPPSGVGRQSRRVPATSSGAGPSNFAYPDRSQGVGK